MAEDTTQENNNEIELSNDRLQGLPNQIPEDILNKIKQPGFYDLIYLGGFIETVTTVPTHIPSRFEQQVKFYVDSLTAPTIKKLYIYSNQTLTWYGIDVLPSQSGNSGKFLTTSGTSLSWGSPGKFGGTGADGALNVTSGTTTLDFGSAKLVVKNYTSINISSGATLTGSNPHNNGTVLILKSQGDVSIIGTLDLREMGAAKATDAWGILDTSSHVASGILTGGLQYSSNLFFYLYNDSNNLYRRFLLVTPGSGGSDGGSDTTDASGGGSGSLFGAGGNGRNTAGNGSNAGGAMAGGGGACNAGSGTGTTEGKRGGGALIIECGGALNFTGTIYTSGRQPGSGSGIRNAAGGSSGGMGVILYNSLTANSGTLDDSGGDGGDLAGGLLGGAGGASTGGLILKNDWFA